MADVLAIVPGSIADGFALAGARVWPADGYETARDLLGRALADPDAGIVALAEPYFSDLDARTRHLVEQRARPLVVPLPIREVGAVGGYRGYLVDLIRRAVGTKLVLGQVSR